VLTSILTECIQMDADHGTLMPTSEFSKMDNLLMVLLLMTLTITVSYTAHHSLLEPTTSSLSQHGRPMMSQTTHSEHTSLNKSQSLKHHTAQ